MNVAYDIKLSVHYYLIYRIISQCEKVCYVWGQPNENLECVKNSTAYCVQM